MIEDTYGDCSSAVFADLFSGTACVAEYFKKRGAQIISNDYLHFSYALQIAKIKLNKEPTCRISYSSALTCLNSLAGIKGFFSNEYTLEGTKDTPYSRNYFSTYNAAKIDAICLQLQKWLNAGDIDQDMFYLLSASLVDAITKVSNTSGTYGAFLKNDDARKSKSIFLEPMTITSNGKDNKCYCRDISNLISDVKGDILYLDPPYNSRQYPPYYHILETAVLYDSPNIYGVTGRRHYENQLSPFCMKEQALPALIDIIKKASFPHIYISYSTEGIIPYKKLIDTLAFDWKVECFYRNYRRYKSNEGGENTLPLKEIIVYVKKN